MWALYICIFLVIYGRMIEIYLVTSVAPVPMAAMMGKAWGGMGQNYLRSLLALGFQDVYKRQPTRWTSVSMAFADDALFSRSKEDAHAVHPSTD